MTLMLAGKNIAILVANGFDENQMTEIQRALIKAHAESRTVAPEQGVVNGWQGESWGHYFPVNAQIGTALGSDFDMLVLPGGPRGIAKLKTNAHTRRIINHFIDAGKPVAAIAEGVELLALFGKLEERIIVAPAASRAELEKAGATVIDQPQVIDGNLLTADGTDIQGWVAEALAFFGETEAVQEAA
ncbi:MAG: DJ-1/PfpI family protein [Pseudomonadota bacterium]|nr:DJ-1/PfpI family protein [Pseudomonadota bacterium]